MPENDIYNNKSKYETFLKKLDLLTIPPEKRTDKRSGKAVYYCRNRDNLIYFRKLAEKFDARDLSYVRRYRIFNTLILLCYATEKDLAQCDRDDIDKIVAFMHTRYNSQKSKTDFIRDIKYIWKILFPENDEKGRIDDTICPYSVRHLRPYADKSKQKARKDKLSWEEYEKIINYFADNPKIQAFLTLAADSFGRPQEILYTRVKDLELYDNYAILHISEHGKEGPGSLWCIDSFPYVLKWYNQHPLKSNKDAFLFVNNNKGQLTPKQINSLLKVACRHLQISKPVRCYSFKRNGITFARLRGDSDVEIQRRARWTSTKQLKTYDLSNQGDALKIALSKRGLTNDNGYKKFFPVTKTCMFCGFDKIGLTEDTCPKCLHVVDREKIKQELQLSTLKIDDINEMRNQNKELRESIAELKLKCDKVTNWQEMFSKMIPFLIKERDAANFIRERKLTERFSEIAEHIT